MSSASNPSPNAQGKKGSLSVESLSAPLAGYPQIATFMTQNPELLMVRRFQALNARNLLYLQAELVYIETALVKCEKEDAEVKEKEDPRLHYSRDYEFLMKYGDSKSASGKQRTLIQQMRAKLKEYSTFESKLRIPALFPADILWTTF
jgi:hypothetical protein